MNQLKSYIQLHFSDPKVRMSFALTLVALLIVLVLSEKEKGSQSQDPISTSDEWIPDGFVLVPLDLQNRESLNALVGGYAVVDLFTMTPDGKTRGTRVGRRLKLVRSPQQPDQFAALVPEEKASLLLDQIGPLFAVIQSRQSKKNSSIVEKQKHTSRIRSLREVKL